MPTAPVTILTPGSKKLFQIHKLWNSKTSESHSFYRANEPSAINTIAIGLWEAHINMSSNSGRYMDCKDNLNGRRTKPGELYESYAIIGGSTSLRIDVQEVCPDSVWSLKVNDIKAVLTSFGLDKSGNGPVLKQRLSAFLKQEEDAVKAAAEAGAAAKAEAEVKAAAVVAAALMLTATDAGAAGAEKVNTTACKSALQDAASSANVAAESGGAEKQKSKRDSDAAFAEGVDVPSKRANKEQTADTSPAGTAAAN